MGGGFSLRAHSHAADLREHLNAALRRLGYSSETMTHARFPGHGGHPAKRNGPLEPGRDRAATRTPGSERRAPGVHPQRGVLV